MTDQQLLTRRGYMQSARDWKNVEVTLYVRVNSFTSSTVNGAAHLELEAQSGRHTAP